MATISHGAKLHLMRRLDVHRIISEAAVRRVKAVNEEFVAFGIFDINITVFGVCHVSNYACYIILFFGVCIIILSSTQLICFGNRQYRIGNKLGFGFIRSVVLLQDICTNHADALEGGLTIQSK